MQKFQEILTEAAQLKESQLKNERKNYQSLPEYIKAGLNYSKKYQTLRKQNYMIQIHMSEKLKKEGNLLFKSEKYGQALHKYEQALAIFRYVVAQTFDNMKDEDLTYETYKIPEEYNKYREQYQTHMIALYLNICSCLTKTNKKEDALHSADEALKIKETAKGYYKKAQIYLQYINREGADIKLGFYYLNKCYEISKDQSVVQEMHKIKKEIDEERDKEKKWFKFMFDKNSKDKQTSQNKAVETKPKVEDKSEKEQSQDEKQRNNQLKQIQKGEKLEPEDEKLQKTKEKLFKFTNLDISEDQWLLSYEGEFIAKHGSKIYSILQIFGQRQYLGEYKSLLAQCLDFKKESVSVQKKKQAFNKYLEWLRIHPIDKIAKYIQRYDLQTQWIKDQRNKLKEKRTSNQQICDDLIKPLKESNLQKMEVKQESKKNLLSQEENKTLELIDEVSKIVEKEPQSTHEEVAESEQKQSILTAPESSEPISQAQTFEQNQKSNIKYWSFAIAFILLMTLKFLM